MAAMSYWSTCPACDKANAVLLVPGAAESSCLACNKVVRVRMFPALRPAPPVPPPMPGDRPGEGETACFYNPERKATATCEQCGVFISEAWKAKWGARTLCLRCLEKLHAEKRGHQFESQRWMWDNIVLGLALLPLTLIVWWTGFIAAPAAVILGIWAWRKPTSIVPRGKARMAIGLTLASAEVIGILVLIYILVSKVTST